MISEFACCGIFQVIKPYASDDEENEDRSKN